MAVFTAEGIDPAVHRRALSFLSEAATAADLAGSEPRYGPIVDDPTKGPGDQVGDYDLGEVVAQHILTRRATLGAFGFTDLSQLSDLDGFGRDKFDDLIHSFGPALYGRWDVLPYPTQLPGGTRFVVAHAALLRTGSVLFLPGFQPTGDTTKTVIWDPSDETAPRFRRPRTPVTDRLYCSGHSFLDDGRLLVVGGGRNFIADASNAAWTLDPGGDGNWRAATPMAFGRWYPTAVTLGDGRVLIASGMDADRRDIEKLEVYDPSSNRFTTVNGPPEDPAAADRAFVETYPGLHLLPSGEIFFSRTGWGHGHADEPGATAAYFTFSSDNTGRWTQMTDPMDSPDRTEGMSVLLLSPTSPQAQVLVVGGSEPRTSGRSSAEVVDVSAPSPAASWARHSLPEQRWHVNAVLLPDSSVFVSGGVPARNSPCRLYDPLRNRWFEMARANYRREYHSVAMLLPSGKVMTTGGDGSDAGVPLQDKTTIELFSPPYLFRGPRPTISDVPELVHHGTTFAVETSGATNVSRVVLVRPMAVTHHTDSEQRVIQLSFSRRSGALEVTAPGDTLTRWRPVASACSSSSTSDWSLPSPASFGCTEPAARLRVPPQPLDQPGQPPRKEAEPCIDGASAASAQRTEQHWPA